MIGLISGDLPWSTLFIEMEEEEVPPVQVLAHCKIGNIAGATEGGFWDGVAKGMFTIVVMGVNAFFAALATQVYKIFTKRWRDGGGSEIPVITTTPGAGGTAAGPDTGTKPGGTGGSVSSDFLNRYRD